MSETILFWLRRGIFHCLPNTWWLAAQTANLAQVLFNQGGMLGRVLPGLRHLDPAAHALGAASARLAGLPRDQITRQMLLLSVWTFLQVQTQTARASVMLNEQS
jgi:hypothetical protein